MTKRDPQPDAVPGRASCTIATQALCYGQLETSVFGVAAPHTREGERAHIGLKFGRILIYLEDRAALESLALAVGQAVEMAGAVFGPLRDAFAEAESEAQQRFERTGDVAKLR